MPFGKYESMMTVGGTKCVRIMQNSCEFVCLLRIEIKSKLQVLIIPNSFFSNSSAHDQPNKT